MRRAVIASMLMLVSSAALTDVPLSNLLDELGGTWQGELYYLDYQSGQRFGIPMRVHAEMTPDGATLIRRLTFTDPGNLVHAVSLVTIDRDSGELVEVYFREGAAELLRFEVARVDYAKEKKWRIVYEHDGRDDDRPARIRHTISRDGRTMTSKKEVRFLNDLDSKFFLRNGTELTLVAAE